MVPESLKAVAAVYDTAKIATPPATTDELLAGVTDGSIKAGFFGGTGGLPQLRLVGGLRWPAHGRDRQVHRRHHRCRRRATPTWPSCRTAGAKFYPNYDDMANAFKAGDIDLHRRRPVGVRWLQGVRPDPRRRADADRPVGPVAAADRRRRLVHQPQHRRPRARDRLRPRDDRRRTAQQVVRGRRRPHPGEHERSPSPIRSPRASPTRWPPASRARRSSSSTTSGATSATRWQLVLETGADPPQAVADACAAMNEANGL